MGRPKRWVRRRVIAGELEAFCWASNYVTTSLESVVALDARLGPAAVHSS